MASLAQSNAGSLPKTRMASPVVIDAAARNPAKGEMSIAIGFHEPVFVIWIGAQKSRTMIESQKGERIRFSVNAAIGE